MADIAVSTSSQLTAALLSSVPGDRIVVDKTADLIAPSGGWVGGVKTGFTFDVDGWCTNPITITTSENIAIPAIDERVSLAYLASLPSLRPTQAPGNTNDPVFKTAVGARCWKLELLRLRQAYYGGDTMVKFGNNDGTQTLKVHQPDNCWADRCLFDPRDNPIWSQKRGLQMHGTHMKDTNNAFLQFQVPTSSGDGQCFSGGNGFGPYVHKNSLYEGGTEGTIYGGDDYKLKTIATVDATPVPTTTSCRLTITNGGDAPVVDQVIAIVRGGGTINFHPIALTVTGAGTNKYDITYAPILETIDGSTYAVPDVGGEARWGAIAADISFDGCYWRQPLLWRDQLNMLLSPTSPTAVANTGGSLPAGSYDVAIAAEAKSTGGNYITSSSTVPITVVLSANGKIDAAWATVTNAERYRIDVKHPDGTWRNTIVNGQATTSGSVSVNGQLNTAIYTGSNKSPSGIRFKGKTLFEIKNAINCEVKNFIWEQHSPLIDIGYVAWIKSNNQNANTFGSPFGWTSNVHIHHGVVRQVTGFMLVSGVEHEARENGLANPEKYRPKMLDGLNVHDILLEHSGGLPNNLGVPSILTLHLANGGKNMHFHHLSLFHVQTGFISLASNDQKDGYLINLQVDSNLAWMNNYGIKGNSSVSVLQGSAALSAHTRGYSVTNNAFGNNGAIDSGTISGHPPGNTWYTTANFKALMTDYDNDNFALPGGSAALGSGLGGTNQGADVSGVLTAVANVVSGAPPVTNPSIITTTPLPGATVGTFYSVAIVAQDGTLPYTNYAITAGALPTGVTINASTGLISGTPSGSPGTASFTVRVTDNAAHTGSKAFTLPVAAASVPLTIVAGPLPEAHIFSTYHALLQASGGKKPYQWELDATSVELPVGLSLDPTGEIVGTPLESATIDVVINVRDANGNIVSQTLTLAVTSRFFEFFFTELHDAAFVWQEAQAANGWPGGVAYGSIDDYFETELLKLADRILERFNAADVDPLIIAYLASNIRKRIDIKRSAGIL
jgi:hypothetical protein